MQAVGLEHPVIEVSMEYKLSSFKFSPEVSRPDKHHVIKMVNSIRSKCPSDSNFTGQFDLVNGLYSGEVKVLFSKGTFLVSATGSNISELMRTLLNTLEDQIVAWKSVRFDQPETFINYSDFLARESATGS